jgi:SAM-dependent methyltransferase
MAPSAGRAHTGDAKAEVRGGVHRLIRQAGKRIVLPVTHALGRLGGRYYFEDWIRVYPDGRAYNRLGLRRRTTEDDRRSFLNHVKFYAFAGQFVAGKRVADVGCGSGYGCRLLKEAGAAEVFGCDVSARALRYARERFGAFASFSLQTIVDLHEYPDGLADVVVSSEVLEHIKEYGFEERALHELRRITAPGGLLVLGTPNAELLGEHGFAFDELDQLLARTFSEYLVFENALVPVEPEARRAWEERAAAGQLGVVVSERIDLSETVILPGGPPELKRGAEPSVLEFAGWAVDAALLHNTHSWVILAVPTP